MLWAAYLVIAGTAFTWQMCCVMFVTAGGCSLPLQPLAFNTPQHTTSLCVAPSGCCCATGEDLKKIQSGSWVAWKQLGDNAAAGGPLFVKDAFYNFLCPQRPSTV